MKRLALLLFVIAPLFAFTQTVEIKPFKGSDKIIVKNELSAEENQKLVIETLLDKGFFIEKKDNEYHTVKTQVKRIGNSSYEYTLNVRSKDKEIVFQGNFNVARSTTLPASVNGLYGEKPIVFKSGAENKLAFKSMENTALSLSMPIIYSN